MSNEFGGLDGWDWLEIGSLAAIAIGAICDLLLRDKRLQCLPDENGLVPVQGFFDKEKLELQRHKWEIFWEVVLILGLIGEIPAALHGIRISSEIKERAANTESNNVVLLAEMQPRRISKAMETNILKSLKNIPVGKIQLFDPAGDMEARIYGTQIAGVLKKAGFDVDEYPTVDSRIVVGVWFECRNTNRIPANFVAMGNALADNKILGGVSEVNDLSDQYPVRIRVGSKPFKDDVLTP